MSREVEMKIFLERGYSKTSLIELCRHLGLTIPSSLSQLSSMSKEELSSEIVSSTTLEESVEIFRSFPLNPNRNFMGRFITVKKGMLSLKNSHRKLSVSLGKLREKHPRILRPVLKAIFDSGGIIDTESIREEFPKRRKTLSLVEEMIREGILEHRYCGEHLTVYEIPEERMGLVAEYLGIKKAEPAKGKTTERMKDPAQSSLEEERYLIAEKHRELDDFISRLEERIDQIIAFGTKLDLTTLEKYLAKLLGDGLHFDGLLTMAQQLGLSETPIVGEQGESGLKTGFSLALFGDPGTGKSFSTRDLLLGSKHLRIPPHGVPAINRYMGGMTAARFIRIGEAYEGTVFNFIIPEFNDWFRYKGMVEPLKLAMEGGTIKYEIHREVIGPYRLSSYFTVNYNTVVGEKGYSTTVRDPNFSAIEDRMVCRLHRMTKERYLEIAKNQMRLLRGEGIAPKEADKIRSLIAAIYAIQKGRGFGKREKVKKIVLGREEEEVFKAAREAIIDAIPDKRLRFSARIEKNALILASSFSLLNYFKFDDLIPLDPRALSLAIRFYVEEASIREGEIFNHHDVLRELNITE